MSRRWTVALLLAGALLPPAPAAPLDEATMRTRLLRARDAIGVDIDAARRLLLELREQARAAGRLDWRLAVDEIDCRLQTDTDPAAALALADAGVALAERQGLPRQQPDLLRLRACRGAMLAEAGRGEDGEAELDDVIARASAPEAAAALGLARLERGVLATRAGRWEAAQQDLLAACALLRPWPREDELCRTQFAHFLRRIGDHDESLRLVLLLRDEARQRGAAFDEGIYVLLIAHLRAARGDHRQALSDYQAAGDLLLRIGDARSAGVATLGLARMLRLTGRSAEAWRQMEALLRGGADAGASLVALGVRLEQAEILSALGRSGEAARVLQSVEPRVRDARNDVLLRDFLLASSTALSDGGRWREAVDVLEEWRRVDARLLAQRQSVQSARLKLQFHRERDAQDVEALRQLAEQGRQLRRAQALAIGLALLLLALTLAYGAFKLRQGRRLQRLAASDELTGLPNRRAVLAFLDEALAHALRSGEPLAVLMVDIDHFKRINDGLGHAVGDAVLRHLGTVLPKVLRTQDRIGRLGGEEFVAVLPGTAAAQARAVAERMREALRAAPRDPSVPDCRISVGLASARPGDAAKDLLARADAALYRAKAAGRDRVEEAASLSPAT